MPLALNEIRQRAAEFSRQYAARSDERAEAQSFWTDFFHIFGLSRSRVAAFEKKVELAGGKRGFIDLFWPGTLIVEHKSRGKNLDKAFEQALDYFPGLSEDELPRYILVSDFARFQLHDLENDVRVAFTLQELPERIHLFHFVSGYSVPQYRPEDPANLRAAELMAQLHDAIEDTKYNKKDLEILLVRILFCLFADDTGIFPKDAFEFFIEHRTNIDGTDVGPKLVQCFETLDTPEDQRLTDLDESLAALPYVNGKLFEQPIRIPAFNSRTRKTLLQCCRFDWSKVSPAIFGSLFQGVMEPQERRDLGAHYTSEKNILKLIQPLFLDELKKEFDAAKNNLKKLEEFHKKLGTLTFFDPACGCGNFLIVAYREIRLLEIDVLVRIAQLKGQADPKTGIVKKLTVEGLSIVDVHQFYGIEYDEFAAKIAETALWMTDHQMNVRLSQAFGAYYARLPLRHSPTILHANALRTDWRRLLPPHQCSYILGNPPFVGSKLQSQAQREDMDWVLKNYDGEKVLDYVCAWYIQAARYIQHTRIKVAFVSTNSISQGEQVGYLWNELKKYDVKIHFAHRTFKWKNEAKGNAAVYCVIVGFAAFDAENKTIFDYETPTSDPVALPAKNVNPYLIDGPDVVVLKRQTPLGNVPKMCFGNMPLDGGHLLLTDEEKNVFLSKEPNAEKYIHPLISAKEFLNNQKRWCLWLVDASPDEIRKMPEVLKRIEAVKKFREASVAPSTRAHAVTPALFRDRNNPETYILVPSTTSENRNYIPMVFFSKNHIANNSCHIIPHATLYHFGVLTSAMHMAWTRAVCGRLEGRYRYSAKLVYNNFPWPEGVSDQQREAVERAAQEVLDARAKYPDSSLADLYDPLSMPKPLAEAHRALDAAVDKCYRKEKFGSESERLAFLFDLYKRLTASPDVAAKKAKKGNGRKV